MVGQTGAVGQVVKVADRAGLAVPRVVDEYDGLVAVFRALEAVKGVICPFFLLIAVLQGRVAVAHTVQLGNVLVQLMIGVKNGVFPVGRIISATKALLGALIDNWNPARCQSKTQGGLELRYHLSELAPGLPEASLRKRFTS